MTLLDEAIAMAGVDPRDLRAKLMAGQPERTVELARAFEEAGQSARTAYERGRRAHGTIADGFGNNGAPVLDAGSADDQAWRLLGQGGQDMDDTAAILKRSVTALDEAQASSTKQVDRMVTEVDALAARWNQQLAANPAAAPPDRQQLVARAAALVSTAAVGVQRTIDTYDGVLNQGAGELAGRGYGAPATFAARLEGGATAVPGTVLAAPSRFVPPGVDPYRGLSPVNGLLTASDAVNGLNGARLEVDAHYAGGYGQFLKSGGERDLAPAQRAGAGARARALLPGSRPRHPPRSARVTT